MSLRTKLLLVFVALAVVPSLAAGVLNYVTSTRAIERMLAERAASDVARSARDAEANMKVHEKDIKALANSPALRRLVSSAQELKATPVPPRTSAAPPDASPEDQQVKLAGQPADKQVLANVSSLIESDEKHLEVVTCLDSKGIPLLRAECTSDARGRYARFQTEDFPPSSVGLDTRVWQAKPGEAFRTPFAHDLYGSSLRFTVPIASADDASTPSGVLVAEMRLDEVFEQSGAREVADSSPEGANAATPPRRAIITLDNATGRIIYHANNAFKHQFPTDVIPFFEPVAEKMRAGGDGSVYFRDSNGDTWLAAFGQVKGMGASVTVAENYSAAVKDVRRAGLFAIALPLAAGIAAMLLLALVARRATQQIKRVAAGAAAIAGGDLNQRIAVMSSDETQALSESFNLMSDRLRELIAREAESKQFESFMRLSAMLTHDLKNAITGLSMLVSNMEKQFHREEFRADAVWSLREATDKLRRIVSRLSEPVKSLSGEYRRDSQPTDLVPIIKRVISANVEPAAPLYEIETRLPETLVATIEPGRIENVIENLVINALEAMGARGGRLNIEAGVESPGRIFFSVADTGTGMTEEFVKTRLFRPFMTTKSKGIGLGLFTCREIVETHGGRLEVESRSGAGTRFRVVLPSELFTPRDPSRQTPRISSAAEQSGPGA